MFEIPVEDLVFVICMLIGGALLLITVLVDDVLGGILESLNIGFDIGGVSLMPLLLAFISMFGVGGLFATQVLDIHEGQAALVGVAFGAVGAFIAWALFGVLQRAEAEDPFSMEDLIGRDAFVAVGIPAGHQGSVIVRAEGMTHEYSATSSADVPSGVTVTVTGVGGSGLIVAPRDQGSEAATAADPSATGEGEQDRV